MAEATSASKQDIPSTAALGKWESVGGDNVKSVLESYEKEYQKRDAETIEERKKHATALANKYYDLVTDFYEYGWGQSFHFARRFAGQSFADSIRDSEIRVADQLNLMPGQRVLDVGCGIGGPMRTIAKYSQAHVVGLNNNDYQLKRLAIHNERNGLTQLCEGVKGDFLHMPFPDNSFDAAYAFEATCHAANRVEVYSEIFRVLKPGGKYAMYEWCLTDAFKKDNQRHQDIRHGVEVGDGLPPMYTTHETLKAMRDAGFELIFNRDMADNGPGMIPWYGTLAGSWSLTGLRMTKAGRTVTHNLCRVMEWTGLAPAGTVASSQLLMNAADSLVAAGETGIFTPIYLVVAVKPNSK